MVAQYHVKCAPINITGAVTHIRNMSLIELISFCKQELQTNLRKQIHADTASAKNSITFW